MMSTFLSGLSPWAARKVFLALASCLTAASAFAGELPSRYAIYHEEVVELEAALPGDLFLVESVTYPDSAKMRIPRNKLIFQSEGFRLDCSRGYNVDGRLYHMNIAFSDGRVWVQDVNVYERQGTVLLPLQSLECVFNGPEKGFQRGAQVVDEEGRFFEIVGFVGGQILLELPKELYLKRPFAGLKMAPGAAKQRSNLLEALVEGAEFERLFAAIRGGVHLDLDSPDGRRLMWLYVMTRLRARDMYRESSIAKFIEEIASFFKIYNVPDKPRWRSVQVIRASGSANLSLRLMARDEAPFRGCLGSDCSTGTRLERALEPAHLNFAIEEEPHKPIGQIEIVLGESEDGKKALAFLERVQSGSNLRTGELMGLVAGLHDVLRENGFTLVALSSLNDYSRLGHPISNFEIIQSRLKEALDNGFDQGQIHRGFRRYRDQFLVKDTKPYNLVADRVGVQGVDVRELHPLPPISKYHLVTNAFPLERIDPQPLNELLQLRLRGWASSASDKVAPQVIREVTERLFPTDCESALSRAG